MHQHRRKDHSNKFQGERAMRSEEMDRRLQEMLDHQEIIRTLAQYCHGCDRCDEVRMADVYLKDSWDEHGDLQASGPDFARIMTARIKEDTSSLYHMLGQSLVKIDGDEAGAETYFLAVSRLTSPDGVEMCNQLGGRFVDRLQRDGDRWRIKHRIVVRDWTIALPIAEDWVSATALRAGQRSNDDPSFAALGIVHSDAKRG
jgi:hypothetical protein